MSMGGKIEKSLNQGKSHLVFKLDGQKLSFDWEFVANARFQPKLAQLYIYYMENAIENRIKSIRFTLPLIVPPHNIT